LVEQLIRNEKVEGSIPFSGTMVKPPKPRYRNVAGFFFGGVLAGAASRRPRWQCAGTFRIGGFPGF
jgi:hypothetical protein